jgi:hypothetical protein
MNSGLRVSKKGLSRSEEIRENVEMKLNMANALLIVSRRTEYVGLIWNKMGGTNPSTGYMILPTVVPQRVGAAHYNWRLNESTCALGI